MINLCKKINIEYKLLAILSILLFFLNTYNKEIPQELHFNQILFFTNYLLASIFINYYLLPNYLYTKRYFSFFIILLLTIFIVMVIEELVLEQIFYPESRARHFGFVRTLIDILPVMSIFTGYKFAWDALQKEKKIETLNRMMVESELQLLNSQINPHFLFNNLNNLYSYALEESSKTPEIILELSSILRYMLYDCKEKFVLLKNELDNLKSFVQLSKIQIEGRGNVEFHSLSVSDDIKIAPLILIVFVENAFKHSLTSLNKNINIKILIDIKDDMLYFYCENNYSNYANSENLSHGIGLNNVKSRLNLIYPKKHILNIEANGKKYCVSLKMNLKS